MQVFLLGSPVRWSGCFGGTANLRKDSCVVRKRDIVFVRGIVIVDDELWGYKNHVNASLSYTRNVV